MKIGGPHGRGTSRVALALAIAVGGGWGVALIVSVAHQDSLTDHVSSLLSTVGGVLAGGIAAYLGSTTPDTQRSTDTLVAVGSPVDDTPSAPVGVDYAGTVGVPSEPTQQSDPP